MSSLDSGFKNDSSHDSGSDSGNELQNATSILYVCSYTEFDNLAHVPKGKTAENGISIFELNGTHFKRIGDVSSIPNPAYMTRNCDFIYVCSESILSDDQIYVYRINQNSSDLELVQSISSEGLSCCYLHITNGKLYCINYWNSVISVFSVDDNHGTLALISKSKGNGIKLTRALHLKDRHSESHTHSIESNQNGFLYVPDLGDDVVKVFKFENNVMNETGRFKTGDQKLAVKGFHGPRYPVFSKCGKICYVVNEISNSVCVLRVHDNGALERIQTISSLPEADRQMKSTCGGINLHPSGRFVSVSNRGHDSISTYCVKSDGTLEQPIVTKTGGTTPRHFKWNKNGTVVFVPNQDTNNVSIFDFDVDTGKMTFRTMITSINSPNYVFV